MNVDKEKNPVIKKLDIFNAKISNKNGIKKKFNHTTTR